MVGAAAAGRRCQGLIDDATDRACATAALRTAAKAAVDLAGAPGRCVLHDATHVVVADHVAGTDDHFENPAAPSTSFLSSNRKRGLM